MVCVSSKACRDDARCFQHRNPTRLLALLGSNLLINPYRHQPTPYNEALIYLTEHTLDSIILLKSPSYRLHAVRSLNI